MKGWIILVSIVFWNLENCFDYFNNNSNASDREFSSRGQRHWTKSRFETKVNLIGKTLLWAELPDIIGVCEVENAYVVKRICSSDPLRKCGYKFVHYDSADPRGIDVALLYNDSRMELCTSYALPVTDADGDTLRTRDILYVRLRERTTGIQWHFYVNHHPSKYGGVKSGSRRMAAMQTLICCVDSLLAEGQTNIVAMGDFNDVPQAEAFDLCKGKLCNMGIKLTGADPQGGSIRFKGKWELIDNFLVSGDLLEMKMEVLQPPFLLTRDREYPGMKPLRTYSGPRWLGGVSDHLPVRLY